jgi:hypothetical protein
VPAIISASRLTDIPRFYAKWFANRRRAGYCHSANSFGSRFIISLRPEDVLGYLFWTRDARPLLGEIASIRAENIPVVVQFTITGYGEEMELDRVPLVQQIESFRGVAEALPAPSCIQLRYDPIIVGGQYTEGWHEETLGRICRELRGYTLVVNTSICEPYITVVSRIERLLAVQYRVPDPERHPSTVRKFPTLATLAPVALLRRLAAVAHADGMQLRVCANPEFLGAGPFPAAQCCGLELFNTYPTKQIQQLMNTLPAPSRVGCHCLAASDIGMSDTCPGGCLYCYVTGALTKSRNFFERHSADRESIR